MTEVGGGQDPWRKGGQETEAWALEECSIRILKSPVSVTAWESQ